MFKNKYGRFKHGRFATKIKKPKTLLISLILGIIVIGISPFEFKQTCAVVLSAEALFLWGISAAENWIISLIFVVLSLICGVAPIDVVLRFPKTENFYIIILSYLVTNAVVSTGTAKLFSKKIMNKFAYTPKRLIVFSYLAGFLLIFLIPQPFPRVILLAAFYKEFLSKQNVDNESSEILYFSIFTASTFTSMFFLSGDMLLNYVVVELADAKINWLQWAYYMGVPTIIICFTTLALYLFVFKKNISLIKFNIDYSNTKNFQQISYKNINERLELPQKKMLLISISILVLFSTQGIHNLSAAIIMLIATLACFGIGIINLSSVKSINWKLLIFFTGAFAVGGVLNYSGVASLLANWIIKLMPKGGQQLQIFFLVAVTIAMNFLLGSAVTTSSVVIPTISCIGVLKPNSAVLALFVYTIVSVQYILPFHHATVMVGYGEGLYSNKIIVKYGIWLTVLTFGIILYVCIPWWQIIGIF